MKFPYFLKRHPVFYSTRFWLTIKKPGKNDFYEEHCNKYVRKDKIPIEFREEIKRIGVKKGNSSFVAAKKIIRYMNKHYGKGRGLGYSTVEILRLLKNNGGGTCSDYSNIFTALCLALNIRVREWGLVGSLKYKNTGKNLGHSFNEIYCHQWKKWILFDPFFGVYFESKDNKQPLGTTEVIDFHTRDTGRIRQVHFLSDRPMKVGRKAKIARYYLEKNIFFLLKGYNIFSQDRILRMHKKFPLPVLHFLLILCNRYHSYIIYLNSDNRHLVKRQLRQILKFNYG
ncbi:transglutaminase-like domain-containing protein [Fulvivirgaceae bacterium BMA12]|uniref:Transglutaminase-like domain-containing protein n=1 Tax=Agaribacillus aureus TaxID=3051825 RepID=A0ABT8L9F0_9BACT|nr:transglutaminase-like domain-containing protein [Fulvivirgaceae bacterium BMA12]